MNNQLNNDQDGKRPDNKDPRQGSGKNHQSILAFLICLLVTLVCFALFTNMLKDNSSEISYDKFIDMVDKDQVKEVTIQSSTLTIVPKKKNSKYEDMSYYTTKTEDSTALTKRLEGKGIKFETDPPDVFGEFVAMILSVVLPTLLLFGLLMFSMRRMNKGGGIMGMGVGKSKAKAYVQQETGVSFKDVAGLQEEKEDLVEVVMRVDKAGIAEHVARVDGLVRLLRKVPADRANEAALGVEVDVLIDRIVIVAGDERADISNEQSRHSVPPC